METFGVVVDPPHHQIGVGAKARRVIPTARCDGCAVDALRALGYEQASRVGVGGQGIGQTEYRVQRVVESVVDCVEVHVLRVTRIGHALHMLIHKDLLRVGVGDSQFLVLPPVYAFSQLRSLSHRGLPARRLGKP